MRGAVLLGAGLAAGGVELLGATPSHAAVPSPTIHGVATWAARPPSSPVTVNNYRPDKIVVHHTATANSTDYSLAHAYALSRSIQNWHMDHNGWIDTGQHFTISRGGHITEGRHRSLETLRGGASFVYGTHAGPANGTSIGIENEGTYTSLSPTTALYDALVDQCAYLCDQYRISASRIYGHRDFMSTQCPGDVLYGMLPQLRADVAGKLGGGEEGHTAIVDNTTSGRFTASTNWGTSSWSTLRHADDYRYATPVESADAAWFKVDIPKAGNHRVEVWHPSNSGYNSSTPHVIETADGPQVVRVDQRAAGGAWRSLGVFNLAAGDRDLVAVSRWTTTSGYVIADAVRVTKI
ncbi:MAG: N-acetylmuramoyl-L-alanine amidase [Micromonosporaceae bacterium]